MLAPGWQRLEELQRQSVESRVVFMAMGYDNTKVDRAVAELIDAVAKTKAGLIDLRVRVEIRGRKISCGSSDRRKRGAYWEAGFAEGLGKKLYYTYEQTKFTKVKTHFDTEHLFTIRWSAHNLGPAVDELKSAIRNETIFQ
jgi:hypothetical protein